MRFSGRLLPGIALLVVAACGPTQPSPIPVAHSFELRAGASASVQGGLTMVFERVASDSRCPMDALCVWAGDATLALRLSHRAGQPAMRELHTQATGSEIVYANYTIKLVSLGPHPRSDRQIKPEDYVATLTVTTP